MDVLIVGGGVAGLEALLGLRAMAGDRVGLALAAPDSDFSYRPLAVAEPFALGHAYRVPLVEFADDAGAELVVDAAVAVDDRPARCACAAAARGLRRAVVAPGARAVAGVEGAVTWWPGGDPEVYGGLLRDIDEGYSKRIAIVVPPGAVWPLPAYELALMTAGEARRWDTTTSSVTVVTPERGRCRCSARRPSAAVTEELSALGSSSRPARRAAREGGHQARAGGERVEVQRVFAVPRLVGPGARGPAGRRGGVHRSPATTRASRARAHVGGGRRRRLADQVRWPGHTPGAARGRRDRAPGRREDPPEPGEPVLHGRLLVGRRSRPPGPRRRRGRAAVVAAGQGRR